MTTQKRIQIALLLMLVLVVGMSTWELMAVREPVYRGKPLSYWLNQYDGNYDSVTAQLAKKETDEAVRHIGTNAIPLLLRRLQTEDSALGIWLMDFSRKHRLKLPLVHARVKCIQGLEGICALSLEDAKVCIPQLAELLNNRAYWNNYFLSAALRHISTEVQNEHMQRQIQKQQERCAEN